MSKSWLQMLKKSSNMDETERPQPKKRPAERPHSASKSNPSKGRQEWDGGAFGIVLSFILGGVAAIFTTFFVASIITNLLMFWLGYEPDMPLVWGLTIFGCGGLIGVIYSLKAGK